MTCRVFESQLSSYLDGELSPVRAAKLEAHLRLCRHCQAELHAMSGISAHIRAASRDLKVSQDFDQRVLRAVGYWQVTGKPTRQRSYLRPLVILVVMLLSVLGLVRHFFSQPIAPPTRAPQPAAAVFAPAAPTPALPEGKTETKK